MTKPAGLQRVFDTLWPKTEGRRIAKARYHIPHGVVMLELDEYRQHLEGLIVTTSATGLLANLLVGLWKESVEIAVVRQSVDLPAITLHPLAGMMSLISIYEQLIPGASRLKRAEESEPHLR